MDIKLKNKNLRIACFVLSLYFITLSLASLFHLRIGGDYLTFKSYFESNQFQRRLNELYSDFKSYNVDYKDYSLKSIDEKINIEELNSRKDQYFRDLNRRIGDIENQYNPQIETAEANGNKDKATRLIDERNKKIDEVKKENSKSLDDIKKELAAQSDNNYNNIKKHFEGINDIKYYLKDTKDGDIYTNLKNINDVDSYIKNNSLYTFSIPNKTKSSSSARYISSQFADLGLEGYIIVPHSDPQVTYYNEYNANRLKAIIQIIIFPIFLALGIYLLRLVDKEEINEHSIIKTCRNLYNKLNFDIKLVLLVFALLLAPNIYRDLYNYSRNSISIDFLIRLTFYTLLTLYFYISIPDTIKNLNNKENLLSSLKSGSLYRLKEAYFSSKKDKNLFYKSIIFVVATSIFSVVAAFLSLSTTNDPGLFIVVMIFYAGFFGLVLLRKISDLDKIINGTDEIVKGNLSYTIKEKGKGNFAKLAHNINNMKTGISKAVESQMKSDRLKSELITNVSHDLKTPLTSIINYVDLLKREDLSKEELQGYIGVLDRKTQRLKILIEDLFEASKMASGAVELNMEKVDVAQLLTQALAEFDEKIKASTLTFKVNIPHHKAYATLDGKKTWRVFENLIGNILKYSQERTRVYVTLEESEDRIIITMKNISAYEMDFDVDEIFERFKRGDASRATEGSGLGLAIAKSIIDIQGGTLNISIDGDLFKAAIELKKYN